MIDALFAKAVCRNKVVNLGEKWLTWAIISCSKKQPDEVPFVPCWIRCSGTYTTCLSVHGIIDEFETAMNMDLRHFVILQGSVVDPDS